MSQYNNYVNQQFKTSQASPKYTSDVSARLRGTRASPNMELSNNTRNKNNSFKQEQTQFKASLQSNIPTGSQLSKDSKNNTINTRNSSNAQSLQGNQIDIRYRSNENPQFLNTGSAQNGNDQLAMTQNSNSLYKSQTSSSPKNGLVISKNKKMQGPIHGVKQSPSPIIGRLAAITKNSKSNAHKNEVKQASMKMVIKTNDANKKTANGLPVKKVIKRALIDIRSNNQPVIKEKPTRINEARNAKIVQNQSGSRNRQLLYQSNTQNADTNRQAANRNVNKTPASHIRENSRNEELSNRSSNYKMDGSNSRGHTQYDRINMIYSKYISDDQKRSRAQKLGKQSSTLSPNKNLKSSNNVKKQVITTNQSPINGKQSQSQNKFMAKSFKQNDVRALKNLNSKNPNIQERRNFPKIAGNNSPKNNKQALTTSKKQIIQDTKNAPRVSIFTLTSNQTNEGIQSTKQRDTIVTQNASQVNSNLQSSIHNQGQSSPDTGRAAATVPNQRLGKHEQDLVLPLELDTQQPSAPEVIESQVEKVGQVKLELPLNEETYQNQLQFSRHEKRCVTQRQPDKRGRKQKHQHQFAHHQQREIVNAKKYREGTNSSVRSQSKNNRIGDSSQQVAQKVKSKMNSKNQSKQIFEEDKQSNGLNEKNQRSRSSRQPRNSDKINQVFSQRDKENQEAQIQLKSMEVQKQNQKRLKTQKIPSLSHSSTSSQCYSSNGDEICVMKQEGQQMNKTHTINGSKNGYDVRSHKINMVNKKSKDEQVSLCMNNSPSKFSLNKKSVGSSRNLRYQQLDREFLDDNSEKGSKDINNKNQASSSQGLDGDVFNYDVDKSQNELPNIDKVQKQDKQEEPEMKIEVISTVVVGPNNEFKTVQGGNHSKAGNGKKAKNNNQKNTDGFQKAFDLIKTAEQMEENNHRKKNSGGSGENRENSLSSDDSLIQTQRKLKQEYAVRLSQQNIDFVKPNQTNDNHGLFEEKAPQIAKQYAQTEDINSKKLNGKLNGQQINPFEICDQDAESKVITSASVVKAKRHVSQTAQKEVTMLQNNFFETKSGLGLKQKLIKRARISLIDNRVEGNSNYSPLKDPFAKTRPGKKGMKFPIHEFISASSDQEEDLIIEKYSQVLRSHEKVLEKKMKDSLVSVRGSQNFRRPAEDKNGLVNSLNQKVELRNLAAAPTAKAGKPLKSQRDSVNNGKIVAEQNEAQKVGEDSKQEQKQVQAQSNSRVNKITPCDNEKNITPRSKLLSETTFNDSKIYMSEDEKDQGFKAFNSRQQQSNMSIKQTQADSKERNYQSKMSNLQNINEEAEIGPKESSVSKSQSIQMKNILQKDEEKKTQIRKDDSKKIGSRIQNDLVFPIKEQEDPKKVYTESVNPFASDKRSCPYIEKNRSPDSFVRISMNEDNGAPLYDRISHLSQRSSHISYISQKSSILERSATKQQNSSARRQENKLFQSKSSRSKLNDYNAGTPQKKNTYEPVNVNVSTPVKTAQPKMGNQQLDQNKPIKFIQQVEVLDQDSQGQSPASFPKQPQNIPQNTPPPTQQQQPEQVQNLDQTQVSNSNLKKQPQSQNIEINIEKILQIQKVLQKINKNFKVFTINHGIKTLRLYTNQENYEFESDNNEMIQNVIQYCEDWWNIIREPQVSALLVKCQRILSNHQIQINLKKSFIYQLVFFTITGYMMSCAQYQFHKQLKIVSERCYFNFLLLCKILVEKFPQETLHKNVWANQLSQIFESNTDFNEEMAHLEKECMAKQRESLLSDKYQQKSQLQFSREIKFKYLRNNNALIFENLNTISKEAQLLSQFRDSDLSNNEIDLVDLHQIYTHQLFKELGYSVAEINDKDNQTDLQVSIERFGKALREDYNEDSPSKTPSGGQNQSDDQVAQYDQGLMSTNNTQMSQEKDLQDQLQHSLRVQVDQGHKLIKAPYLPPLNTLDGKRKYTLVLDLDETLLHFEELNDNEGQLSIRPGADSFLKLMSTHFEIVIFTAGTEEYADWALEFMENVSCITHRLYRQHALPFKGYYVKDLSRIGRSLTKTIIVDNIAENFALQPAQGILIKTWISDPKDTSLFELAPLLLKVVESQTEDVRELLKFYQNQNSELMQSIAYGSKEHLNTMSNQMTIAQDTQLENYEEYDGGMCAIQEDQNEQNEEDANADGELSKADEEGNSTNEKSNSSMREQLLNSVDARQRKLKASLHAQSYLSQSSSETTPNQDSRNGESQIEQGFGKQSNLMEGGSYSSQQVARNCHIQLDGSQAGVNLLYSEPEIDQNRQDYFNKINAEATIYTIKESLNEFGSTPSRNNSPVKQKTTANKDFSRLSDVNDSDFKIINKQQRQTIQCGFSMTSLPVKNQIGESAEKSRNSTSSVFQNEKVSQNAQSIFDLNEDDLESHED